MEQVAILITFMSVNWMAIIGGITSILAGIIAICLVVPGPYPENFLQPVLDFLKKISAK